MSHTAVQQTVYNVQSLLTRAGVDLFSLYSLYFWLLKVNEYGQGFWFVWVACSCNKMHRMLEDKQAQYWVAGCPCAGKFRTHQWWCSCHFRQWGNLCAIWVSRPRTLQHEVEEPRIGTTGAAFSGWRAEPQPLNRRRKRTSYYSRVFLQNFS